MCARQLRCDPVRDGSRVPRIRVPPRVPLSTGGMAVIALLAFVGRVRGDQPLEIKRHAGHAPTQRHRSTSESGAEEDRSRSKVASRSESSGIVEDAISTTATAPDANRREELGVLGWKPRRISHLRRTFSFLCDKLRPRSS